MQEGSTPAPVCKNTKSYQYESIEMEEETMGVSVDTAPRHSDTKQRKSSANKHTANRRITRTSGSKKHAPKRVASTKDAVEKSDASVPLLGSSKSKSSDPTISGDISEVCPSPNRRRRSSGTVGMSRSDNDHNNSSRRKEHSRSSRRRSSLGAASTASTGTLSSSHEEQQQQQEQEDISSLRTPRLPSSVAKPSLIERLQEDEMKKSATMEDVSGWTGEGGLRLSATKPGSVRRATSAGDRSSDILHLTTMASFFESTPTTTSSRRSSRGRRSSGEILAADTSNLDPSNANATGDLGASMQDKADIWHLTNTISSTSNTRPSLLQKLQADEKLGIRCRLPSIIGDSLESTGEGSHDVSELSNVSSILATRTKAGPFCNSNEGEEDDTEAEMPALDGFYQFDPSKEDNLNLMAAGDDDLSIFPMQKQKEENLAKTEQIVGTSKVTVRKEGIFNNIQSVAEEDENDVASSINRKQEIPGDEGVDIFKANWVTNFNVQSDNACGHFEDDEKEAESEEESKAQFSESYYSESESNVSQDTESSKDDEENGRFSNGGQPLLQLNFSKPDGLAFAACDVDDTSIFRMDSNSSFNIPRKMEMMNTTEIDQQSKQTKSKDRQDKRGSLFSSKLLKAKSFKKAVGKTKSFRLSKESKNKHMHLSSSDHMTSSCSVDDKISSAGKQVDVIGAGQDSFQTNPIPNKTDPEVHADNEPNKAESGESKKVAQKKRRDNVKSRRESTREKSTVNEERQRKRDAYRKATSSRNVTDNSPKQKKRASHIGQGRRRVVSVSRNKTALSLAKAQLDHIDVTADVEESTQDDKVVVENIRKRSAMRKAQSVRDVGTARSVGRNTSGIEDNRKGPRRTKSGVSSNRKSVGRTASGIEDNRKPLGRTASGVVANRKSVGRSNSGIENYRRPLRRTQSSTPAPRQRSTSRNRRRSSDKKLIIGWSREMRDKSEGDDDCNKSRQKNRGEKRQSRRARKAMGDGSKEDEIGNSRESIGGEVRGKRRLRRKDSGDDFSRSKEREPKGTKEKRRGGKNPHTRQSEKTGDGEGSGADIDSSVNSLRDSDDSGEDIFQLDEANPKGRRSLLRKSTSANQMADAADDDKAELAPADQIFDSRVGGSSSMRVERTTFESSIPAVKSLTIDDFATTVHTPKGGSGKDRQPSFMKSLGDKLGATKTGTISKGARNLIIGGIGGANRNEKRRLLDVDDDSVLS